MVNLGFWWLPLVAAGSAIATRGYIEAFMRPEPHPGWAVVFLVGFAFWAFSFCQYVKEGV